MKIIVCIKNVYGEEKAYPHCETAKKFAALLGTKTLTKSALRQIKELGYQVDFAAAASWSI